MMFSVLFFATVAVAAVFSKGKPAVKSSEAVAVANPKPSLTSSSSPKPAVSSSKTPTISTKSAVKPTAAAPVVTQKAPSAPSSIQTVTPEPLAYDRVYQLFNKGEPKLPIVETITYSSRVPWLQGRPAWIVDYASHYKTSKHFIARSLSNGTDYEKQEIADGDQFNVLRLDKDFNFYLVVDLHRCQMWFYYIDLDTNERVLLRKYSVGLGREDTMTASGYKTPLGKYLLGPKVTTYRPGVTDYYMGKKTEMIRVFGTRWIPFEKEVGHCTAPAKGFGIHGAPWDVEEGGKLRENLSTLGEHSSDGCVRMSNQDIQEIFSIVVCRPTYIEIVDDFYKAELPGIEK